MFTLHAIGNCKTCRLIAALAGLLALAVLVLIVWHMGQPPAAKPERDAKPDREASGPTVPDAKTTGTSRTAPQVAPSGRDKPPDFSRHQGPEARISPQQLAALDKLRHQIPGVTVDFDPLTGAPASIVATGRFLAPPASNENGGHAAVREFMDANAGLFGYDSGALQQTRLVREDVAAHNGMRTTVWQQEVDGIPLYNTILQASVTKDGALVTLGSHFLRDAPAATMLDAARRAALIAQPPINAPHAIALAAANLGDPLAAGQVAATTAAEGPERKQRFSAPDLSDTTGQLAWLPTSAATAVLAWDVTLMSISQNAMFRVVVDATTGEVVMRTCLTNDLSNAGYRVYADATTLQPFDSPTPMSPGLATPANTQPASASRNLITIQALDTTASPNGWINDGDTATYGNNVDSHLDTSNTNPTFGTGTHATSSTRNFDFTQDLTQAPATYQNATITQLFYLCNWYHDRTYALGFTETAGNFQQNNLGRGGLGNDAVLADAQDGGGTNNANFSTPSDGSPGRMQMYVFTGPAPDRDGALDAEIVLHEFTHGLSNRLVGGGVGMSALQSKGLGEGWSDFYALCLLSQPGDDANANYASAAYASYQLGGLTENYYYGIRRYPYATNMGKNPLTLKDLDPTQASTHTGIPKNPIIGSTAYEVHNMGEVWCVTLWDARANLILKLGAADGNQMILQLVTDGMKLSPSNPTYLQARNAIIQADLVNNGGAHKNELWSAFAKRGMGSSATVPVNTTTTGIVEAFDQPELIDLAIPAFATEGEAPVTGTVTVTPTPTSALVVNLSSNDATEAGVPATVTIPAGQTTTTFPITIIDDTELDGTRDTTITATATGYPGATSVIAIQDNETATLTITAPPATDEGAGTVQGTVTMSTATTSAITVSLTSSDPAAAQAPATLIIPAGQTSAPCTIVIVDDNRINGTHTAKITAHVANWTDGETSISISDNENSNLGLSLPGQVVEGSTGSGTVTIAGTLASPLTVSLESDTPTRLVVPASVTIAAGLASATFSMTAPDNTLPEGTQAVTITASAPGFTGAGGSTNVLDNTAHHFAFSTITSPKNKGTPFSVAITAQDSNNATVTTYSGTPALTANGDSGAVSVSPTNASGFVNGVWTGSVTINAADNNIILTVADNLGRTGQSNPFNVTVPSDFFTELFDNSGNNDVSNQSFLFTPNGSNNFYAVQRTATSVFPTDPAGGASLTMGDDTYAQVIPAGGVSVSIYGSSYTTLYVGSNGYVTFGSGDSTLFESLANHFSKPRIAALFDDLYPTTGQVTWKQTSDQVAITWQSVPEYGTTNSNSFQISMYFDGRIRITCLGIAAKDGLIGLSQGLGIPFGFIESNFSAYPSFVLGVAAPAIVTECDAPVTGTITTTSAPAGDLVINLASSNTAEATVPATATIPAGQLSTTFPITIIDDTVLDGTQNTTITATATGSGSGSTVMAVQDNETATLAVTSPATTIEGAGTVFGTITISAAPARAITVNLISSDTTEVTVPATLVIAAGLTSATFTITVVDDSQIDGNQNATITAHMANWTDGSASIIVEDNENTNLALKMPATVSENGTATGTVSLSGTISTALTVELASNSTARLTLPATATIPAGSSSAPFTLTAPDNTQTDGTQVITITATAAGYTGTTGTISVLDNDVHHFSISTIASPQSAGAPFGVTLTAKDINDVTMVSYSTIASLSASGSGGIVSMSPAATTAFASGVWTGNVTVNTPDNNVILTVSAGGGHTGTSNPFSVNTGTLHHFAWSTVANPQTAHIAFGTTITAQDIANNTVTSFTGTANMSGFTGGASQTLLNSPVYSNSYNAGTYTLGYSFTPSSNILVTAVRSFSGTKVSIWTNAGVLLASVPVSASPGSWTETPLASTLQLQAGTTYRIGFLTGGTLYYWRTDLPAGFPHGSIDQSYESAGDTFPTNPDSPRWWFIDLKYAVTIPVAIQPITTGAFESGIWAGNISVLQAGTGITLHADDGSGHSGDSNSFDTILAPTANTLAATDITETSATLHGTINANAASASVSFDYGNDTSYGTSLAGIPSPVTGNADTAVSATLTGLVPNTSYHFRVTGVNSVGTTHGTDLSFTTAPSSNADLSNLTLGAGTISPAFASGITSYTASVSNTTSAVTLTPTVAFGAASVRVNGVTVASGSASGAINLALGENPIDTVVTAQDGVTQRTYTLVVTRRTPYQDWAVGLGLGGTAMNPAADTDADGVTNLMEWAFDTDPASPVLHSIQVTGSVIDAHGAPVMLTVRNLWGGTTRLALFGRRKDAAAVGLTYSVEFSANLAGWAASSHTPTIIAQDSVIEAVIVPFPTPGTGPAPTFFRVRVTGQ